MQQRGPKKRASGKTQTYGNPRLMPDPGPGVQGLITICRAGQYRHDPVTKGGAGEAWVKSWHVGPGGGGARPQGPILVDRAGMVFQGLIPAFGDSAGPDPRV